MGLTLHYTLESKARTFAEARRLVERLRAAACELPFDEVQPLVEFEALPGEYEDFPAGMFHATSFVKQRGEFRQLEPRRFAAFRVNPAGGSESAEFGLARYGRRKGWSWHAFCKTQYASGPQYGGVANFLRCHTAIVALLDRAVELGISATVTDDSGYWHNRDAAALAREISRWNELIAYAGGQFKDTCGGNVSAPIFEFPDFEHLEARGQSRRNEDGPN